MMKYKSSNKLIGCFRAKDISPLHACVWLLLLLLASCGETVEVSQPELPVGTPVSVTADLQVSICPIAALQPVSTRGEEADESDALGVSYLPPNATRADVAMSAAEKEIKSAYVVQFDGTAPTSTAVWVSNDVSAHLKSGSPVNVSFTLTAGVKSRVYVVANPTKVPTVNMTLQAFETVSYTASTSVPSTGLPMAAGQDVAAGETFSLFQLKSALARLTFTTNLGTLTLKGIPSAYSLYAPTPGASAVRPSGVTYTATANLVSGTAYYIPANLSGQVDLSDEVLRCASLSPANAMYVVISANSTTYNVYLGDGTPQDFNVVGNYAYTVNTTINGTDVMDMRVGDFSITALDGSGSGTANCYIATGTNTWYSFSGTVMGNGKETPAHTAGAVPDDVNSPAITPTPLTPASADVLWETWNTTETPTKGSVVRGVYLANGRVVFRSGSMEGNAVVAIYQSGESLPCWSWHIWRVNTDPRTSTFTFPAYTSTSGNFDDTGTTTHPGFTMMHCNLGALSSAANDNLSTGLYYQWGRKDPMPGVAGLSDPNKIDMATTPAGIPVIPSAAKQYTVAESIQLPTTFLKYGSGKYDWCSVRTDNLWGTPLTGTVTISGYKFSRFQGSKSIYDPCPPGWRVPPEYAYANLNNTNFTWSTNGRLYSSVWFPASGSRNNSNGTLNNVGSGGYYWTSTPNAIFPSNGSSLYFDSDNVFPAFNGFRASGYSVRCQKE